MKKTVIDELIEKLELRISSMNKDNKHHVTVRGVLQEAINEAEELKEKHKREIIKVFTEGRFSALDDLHEENMNPEFKTGTQYYKENYLNE